MDMLITAQNVSAGKVSQGYLPERPESHHGIRLYEDDEVSHVTMEDTRHRWNILLFQSEVYAPDMGCINSGLYIAPFFDFIDWIGLGVKFKGYLLSIPFDTWKVFDIYDLDLLFESRLFIPYVALDKKEARALGLIMDIFGNAVELEESPLNEMELMYVCRALFATLNRYYRTQRQPKKPSTGNPLADRFFELIEKNCLQEKRMDFYAKELKVSAKYLSHIVVHVTGKNANKWISEYVIEKAKRMLVSSVCPIQSIAEKSGFSTSSEFCRYFRLHTGMTPLQYRRQSRTTVFPR